MIAVENKTDRMFFVYVAILVIFGLFALTSASGPLAFGKFNDSYFFIKRQILFGLLPGIFLFLFFLKVDYEKIRKLSFLFYLFCIVLLALVFVPGIGLALNGAKSWISLFGFSFQPSEAAKLGMIIFAAHLLSDKKRNLNDWQMGLLPILTLLSPVFVLVLFQPDVGTLSIMLVVLFAMMFFAKVPKKYLFTIGMFCLIALVIMVFVKPYRMQRIQVFMHPEIDPLGKGYHMNQAFLAIGSGGLWGLGVGQSRQKYQYLPEVHADSIFAIISEETGFFISTIFICLILLLGLRGLKISKYATDGFARLASVGVVVWIVWQSFLNIGAMVGVLPITGVPLPFVSHGGSALAAELAAAGLVLNISRK